MLYVTKAMPIPFIDCNKLKSCRMGLTNHTQPISHHIMPLVINVLRGRHTHTHTDAQTKTILRNQACSPWLCSWFKKNCMHNKAKPIHFINGKCHIEQLKAGKSHKTCLTNCTQSISLSHHIMPLVINGLRGRHSDTHKHTYQHLKKKPGARGLLEISFV